MFLKLKLLTRQYFHDLHPLFTNCSFSFYCIFQWNIVHFIIQNTHKNIMSSFHQAFHCMITHTAGNQPVKASWSTTSLNMPKDANTCFICGILSLTNLALLGTSKFVTFCHHDKVHQFFSFLFFQKRCDAVFNISLTFRD